MLSAVVFVALAQIVAAPNAIDRQIWPTVKPGRVIESPDWADSRLYHKRAVEKREEGSVTPEIFVGVDGKPKACRILASSNFPELDAGTCELMMRIRFEPARDSQGTPIPSRFSREVIWLLSEQRPFASSTLKARLDISGGHLVSCEVVAGDGPYFTAWSAMACRLLEAVSYYFGTYANSTAGASVEFRLDAGDHAPALDAPWTAGTPVAAEKLSFAVNREGAPALCTPLERHGFGPRDVADTSCGPLLNVLWFEDAPKHLPPRKGVLETRVVLIDLPPR